MNKTANIKIGLIDSGVNLSSPLINKTNIIDGYNSGYNDFKDYMNHGTICAHLIQQIQPDVQIYNIKVFDKKLVTSSTRIIEAIKWCIGNNIRIINLSISVNDVNYYYDFKDICDLAFKNKIIIVASADNLGRPSLPAYLDNVFGVGVSEISNSDYFYIDNCAIQLYANGLPAQNEACINSKLNLIQTTSYATARITGIISDHLNSNTDLEYSDLNTILKFNSRKLDSGNFCSRHTEFNFKKSTIPIILKGGTIPILDNIKDTTIIGSSYEASFFKNFSHFLTSRPREFIELNENKTFLNSYNKGFSTKELSDYELPSSIINGIQNSKTLILSKLPSYLYSHILKISKIENKNVLSLYPLKPDDPSLANMENNSFYSDSIFYLNNEVEKLCRLFEKIPQNHIIKNQFPILCIANLCENQNSFNVELTIREKLLNANLKLSQISTNPFSELFGLNYTISIYNQIPIKFLSLYAKSLIESLNFNQKESDLLIVGLENQIISSNLSSSNVSDTFTLPVIALLLGYQPDFFILVINELTEVKYIIRNINFIKSFLETDNIYVISDSLFEQISPEIMKLAFTSSQNIDQLNTVSKMRINIIRAELQKQLGITVFDIDDKILLQNLVDRIKE